MTRFTFIAVLLLPLVSAAQPFPEMVTDRPDFTESGVTVPSGHVQIESGILYDQVVDTGNVVFPEVLVRWAPLNRFELRFGIPNYMAGDVPTGFSDGSLGAKVQFGPFGAWDLGLIAAVSLPIGEEELTSDSVDPEFILITGRDLSSRVSVGAQGMLMYDGVEDVWQYGGTLVLGAALSERAGTFVEAMVIDQRANSVLVVFHHGYTYLLTPTLQLDVHAGLGFFEGGGGEGLVGVGASTLF